MEHNSLITKLQQAIQNNYLDIKAESILAIAMENELTDDDFIIALDGLFCRSYSKDILFTTLIEDAERRDFLQLHLSRNGIYDQLPEGLFHLPVTSKPQVINATDMAADSKLSKQREREIRRFFMPFENAFFEQRLQLELEETRLLKGLHSGTVNDFFQDFWGISSAIPSFLLIPLIELLPYAYKIAGNLAVTAQCLEKILQEKVSVRMVSIPFTQVKPEYTYELGLQRLGIDIVIGDQFEENYPQVEFTIGPLQHSQIPDYLERGNKEEFIKTFYSFFVPAEAEVITRIEVEKEEKNMVLTMDEPILGYSTILL